MNKFIWLILLISICGCDTKIKPTIKVEISEDKNTTSLTINHSGQMSIVLDDLEEIQSYRQEVEFLLLKLQETEDKLLIREDSPEN